MKDIEYISRIADKTLDLRLEAFGAVQIAGPKRRRRQIMRNVSILRKRPAHR